MSICVKCNNVCCYGPHYANLMQMLVSWSEISGTVQQEVAQHANGDWSPHSICSGVETVTPLTQTTPSPP